MASDFPGRIVRFFIRIKNRFKDAFDTIGNEQLKINILQAIPFWIGSIITGLAAVFYTKLFSWAEAGTHYIFEHFKWGFFIISPLCFLFAWWIVKRYAPFSRGSGIPQVMAAIELATPGNLGRVNKLLGLRIIIVKVISSLVLALGGGAIGREGPTIQIAGSIFRKINQILPAWWPKISKRNMIMTGSAAGLAAAFNTPLGGIVFAIEELTKTHISYFKTALFSAVIIAGLTAQGLLGPYLYLGYPNVSNLSWFIFLGVILVAAIAGLGGSGSSKMMLKLFNYKKKFKFKYQHLAYVAGCALILAMLAMFIDERVFGSGKEVMASTLFTNDPAAKHVAWYLPILRIIGPIVSFTTGAAGGVFAPALGAGASIGSVVSGWLHLSSTDTNLLILAGMVGFLTGITRSPFTSAILVLEMTDRHNVIFHLMLAGMVASVVSILVDKHSFYDRLKEQYIDELTDPEEKAELEREQAELEKEEEEEEEEEKKQSPPDPPQMNDETTGDQPFPTKPG